MTDTDLCARFRGIVCDLDGVVYRTHLPIEYAVESLEQARGRGLRIIYATNNAAREPSTVAQQLRELGVHAPDDAVVTSSMAGAAYLARQVPPGAPVLAVGGQGVAAALVNVGLRAVRAEGEVRADPVAVLQGYGPDVSWRDLAAAAYAIQAGAQWVATNLDKTIPTSHGIAPGNGSLVAAVRAAVADDPVVMGKPQTPLYELCATRLGIRADQTLAIGDRLDTDILGANRAGMASLCVLTGVHHVPDLVAADGPTRPTLLATDLRALHRRYDEPTVSADNGGWRATCGQANAAYRPGSELVLADGGCPDTRLRAVVALMWAVRDQAGGTRPADLGLDADQWARIDDWITGP